MAMNEEQISSAMREILFKHWDPIGLGAHLPRDEYDRYIPPLIALLYSRAPRERFHETLKSFEVYFGITIPDENTRNTVEALQRLYSKNAYLMKTNVSFHDGRRNS